MKVTSALVICILALCLVEETSCKAITKEGKNNSLPKGGKISSSDVNIHSKPKLQPKIKLEPSGRETDVDDAHDLLVHDRRELLETREPCAKGVACRRRKKRQFSKLIKELRGSTPGNNGVYDLQTMNDNNNDTLSSSDSLFDDDGDDDDDSGHIVVLRQRKRREFDVTSDDSDDDSVFDHIGDKKLSYSEILGSYLHGEDDTAFRAKRHTSSDSSFTDELENVIINDSDNEEDTDLSVSSDDWSSPLLKDRPKRDTDVSSLDTFEEENDEIFDDDIVYDNTDDESDASDVDEKTVDKRQQVSFQNNSVHEEPAIQDETKEIQNDLDLEERDESLENNNFNTGHRTGEMTQQIDPALQDEDADDNPSSSNARNSGPETESDAELSDIPLDDRSVTMLDRVPRDSSQDITVFEESGEPNSGYMEWEAWDPCSVTCGVGRSTRRRVCINPAHCKAGDVEIEACVLNEQYEC